MISNIRDSVDNCLRRTIKNINEKKYSKKNFRSNRDTYENSSVVVLISLPVNLISDSFDVSMIKIKVILMKASLEDTEIVLEVCYSREKCKKI